MAKPIIYLSSTYEDLKEYRRVVFEALRKAGYEVIAMEEYVSRDQRPVDQCLRDVEKADIYVGLFAFRYGYVPPPKHNNPSGLSITELELRRAEELNKPCLTFIAKENLGISVSFVDGYTGNGERGDKIQKLRKYLCQEKLASLFTSPEKLAIHVLTAVKKELDSQRAEVPNTQKHTSSEDQIEWPAGKSPYPGLLWFDEEYAPMFFGRDREVDDLVEKMYQPAGRFLVISGASGSGKSSLVGGGLWRALLQDGRLPGSRQWRWLRIQPGDGQKPLDSLVWGLKQTFPRVTKKPADLAQQLTGNKTSINELLALHLLNNQELLLFVDQLEELFTQGFDGKEIQQFLEQLVEASGDRQNHLRVVATMRSEFMARLEESEPIRRLLNIGFNYHLGLVSTRIMQDMIVKPAQATGNEFEAGLVEDILSEAAQEPGNLPLVAYLLKQLFERRQGHTFTKKAYQDVQGMVGAIGTQADQVLGELDTDALDSFEKVFAELVHIEREGLPTRKRVPLANFKGEESAIRLIHALTGPDSRVLVIGGSAKDSTVEVAHEKLFTAWKRLREWIDESREFLRTIDYAEETARRWHKNGEKEQELWPAQLNSQVLAALQRFGKKPSTELDRFLRPQQRWIKQLDQSSLPHSRRLEIGRLLATMGDPRPGVGLREDGLPSIQWVDIPGGQVESEDNKRRFKVKAFRIAKYLLTNIQFEAFLNAEDGYQNPEWWKNLEKPKTPVPPRWTEANSPRETVSWDEAVAFCRWLSQRTGSNIRLPTEWEWQRAALGRSLKREYPWGHEWEAERCNSGESKLNRTSAVGIYPSGATPQGVLDMAGNVWEWCLNEYDNAGKPESIRIHEGDSSRRRVVRGGSFDELPEVLRSTFRLRHFRVNSLRTIGFRLAQDIR